MNVVGYGIDIVVIADIQRWLEDPRDPFLSRCFTKAELEEVGEASDKPERIAGKFAAKEAVLKALGTGYGDGIAFSHVLILREPGQPPRVELVDGAAAAARERGIEGWLLSISHSGGMAVAGALALGSGTVNSASGET